MKTSVSPAKKVSIKTWRHLIQLLVLMVIVVVPWLTQNPVERSPSRIVLGQLPDPVLVDISGDTWAFSFYGFDLIHPLAFIENVVTSKSIYLPIVLAVLFPMIITVLWGRVFCSWMCPVGFLLELNTAIAQRIRRSCGRLPIKLPNLGFALFPPALFFAFLLGVPLLALIDPPHVLGREMMSLAAHNQVSVWGVGVLAFLLFADIFIAKRACCNSLCPSGAALSFLGRKRLLRINMKPERCVQCGDCDTACPYNLTPMELKTGGFFDWNSCDNCGLCIDSCRYSALCHRIERTSHKE